MKRLFPVLGVALLIAALILVNRGISHNARPDDDDDDSTTSSAQTTQKPATPPAPGTPGQTADIAPEIIIGNPAAAKRKITVGWVYDTANQANPQALNAALQVVQQAAQASNGTTSAEIVDLDVPRTELSPAAGSVESLGVFLDGKPIGPSVNPGAPGLTADVIGRSLPR